MEERVTSPTGFESPRCRVTARAYSAATDAAKLADLFTRSRPDADRGRPPVTAEQVRQLLPDSSTGSGGASDVHLFFVGDELVGYERTRRETWTSGIRVYHANPFVHPEWRRAEVLTDIAQRIVEYQGAFSAHDPHGTAAFLSLALDPSDAVMIEALRAAGFEPRHYFLQMARPLEADVAVTTLPAPLEIRPLREEDYRRVYAFDREIMRGCWGVEAPSEEHFEWWSREAFRNPELWAVAWAGGSIVGTSAGIIGGTWNPTLGAGTAEIRFVRVAPPWRRKGVATALIVRCLAALRTRGIKRVVLGVDGDSENTAAALYRTLGFEVTSRAVAYCRDLNR